ncbi:divergent polysaccharide deacetylase family protein [Alphaproteobacteria bacterium]|nr:divergent polysaccharide deacetylase family protein [Alphaproteobacteria bacterium]
MPEEPEIEKDRKKNSFNTSEKSIENKANSDSDDKIDNENSKNTNDEKIKNKDEDEGEDESIENNHADDEESHDTGDDSENEESSADDEEEEEEDEDEDEDEDERKGKSSLKSFLLFKIIPCIVLISAIIAWLQFSYTPKETSELFHDPSIVTKFELLKTEELEKKVEEKSIQEKKDPKKDKSKDKKKVNEEKSNKNKLKKVTTPSQKKKKKEILKLSPSPDPKLVAESDFGPLPKIGEDGREPWKVYSRPFTKVEGKPKIAIFLAGLGLSEGATNMAIQKLPGPITLGFAPYASRLEEWIALSRAAGHEVILQLPMESFDYPSSDPGPHTLLTSLEPEINIQRLNFLLSRFTGYVGVTNFLGNKFTSDQKSLKPILDELNNRGLLLLDTGTSQTSISTEIALNINLPIATNNHFIDSKASRVAIDAKLFELEKIALEKGVSVGIGFSYPVTMERITEWSSTLDSKGIDLAPISAIVSFKEKKDSSEKK